MFNVVAYITQEGYAHSAEPPLTNHMSVATQVRKKVCLLVDCLLYVLKQTCIGGLSFGSWVVLEWSLGVFGCFCGRSLEGSWGCFRGFSRVP
jgi:hypothetical protein